MYKTIPSLNPSRVLNTQDLIELTKRYKEIMESQKELKDTMWSIYGLGTKGTGKSPHKEYLENLIHEANSKGGTVLSTLANMEFYEKNDWQNRTHIVIKESMYRDLYHIFSSYLLLEQSILMYYAYGIGENFIVKFRKVGE